VIFLTGIVHGGLESVCSYCSVGLRLPAIACYGLLLPAIAKAFGILEEYEGWGTKRNREWGEDES